MTGVRELFLGNWRNKGVALFFAVTIWYVAYQSEKKELSPILKVDVRSVDQNYIVTRIGVDTEVPRPGGPEFDGSVVATFSGPRKEIDRLERNPLPPCTILVPVDKTSHTFRQEDFGFPRDGVEITQFDPQTVLVGQEEIGTVTIKNVTEKINVTRLREGYDVAQKEVIPSTLEVRITGPKSVVSRLGVSLEVTMGFSRDRYEGETDVSLTYPDDIPADVVFRTVKVEPARVQVLVVVRPGMEVWPVDAIRVTFRVPPLKIPLKIVLDDAVGDTIPVEFYGPNDEISRLKGLLREQPGFSLGVRVPPFDREQGVQGTFTEDTLELYGFPSVKIRQHETRRKDRKTAWSYTVVPVKEKEEAK